MTKNGLNSEKTMNSDPRFVFCMQQADENLETDGLSWFKGTGCHFHVLKNGKKQ